MAKSNAAVNTAAVIKVNY